MNKPKLREVWLATDEDGSKHLFGSCPVLHTNIFGEKYWVASVMIDVNNIKDFLPRQTVRDKPRLIEIAIKFRAHY